jgi:signal transduction histidine kinase
MSGAPVLADMPSMASGLDAVRSDPVAAGLAGAAILLLAVGAGFALRRWSGRLRTLRSQLLVIAIAAIAVAAGAAWLLADLMILSEEQLGPVLIVLAMTAGIAAVVAAIASTSLGRAAHDLEETVRRIEEGERTVQVSSARSDELGHVARALEGLTLRLAELEEERAHHDAERSHMLSSISHDLRSPLAALRAALEALIDGVARDPDRYLRSMQADVDALASLVDDFFLLARIEGGDLSLDLGTVDLSECCDEALEALSPSAHQHDVHLELDAMARVQVRGNASALGRVVRNLVDNAIRHAPAGSTVRVTVGAEGRPVVAVVDGGSGFPVGFAEHAFERWSRADESRSRETGGAGLGLAIARGLVLAHGGRIWIDPPPGGRVAFELPAA